MSKLYEKPIKFSKTVQVQPTPAVFPIVTIQGLQAKFPCCYSRITSQETKHHDFLPCLFPRQIDFWFLLSMSVPLPFLPAAAKIDTFCVYLRFTSLVKPKSSTSRFLYLQTKNRSSTGGILERDVMIWLLP